MKYAFLLAFLTIVLSLVACNKKSASAKTEAGTGTSENITEQGAAKSTPSVAAAEVVTKAGLLRENKGQLEFIPCDAPTQTFQLVGETEVLRKQYLDATSQGYVGQNVVAQFTGIVRTASRPRGGGEPTYPKLFEVKEIIKIRPKNKRNTCIKWDYWASGNEPYWDLQISAAEGVMELNLIGEPTLRFDYAAPTFEQDGKRVRYYSIGTSQRLKVALTKEECLDDMAGNRYEYSAEVQYAGKTLTGCAMGG